MSLIKFLQLSLIAYTKKYPQSELLRGVQYWPYLYPVFNICTLLLNKKKSPFDFGSGKKEIYSLKTNSLIIDKKLSSVCVIIT